MEQDKEQNKEQDKEKERRPRSSFGRLLRSKRTWGTVVLMAVIAVIIWQLTPVSDKEVRRNELVVEVRSWYELRNDSGVVLTVGEIEGDTALTNISTDTLQPAAHVQLSAGYWVNRFRRFPSCHGRIVTKAAPASSQLVDSGSQDLHTVVRRQAERIENELASLQTQQNELHYYRRTHNVQDYGYQEVAALDTRINRAYAEAERVLQLIDSITDGNHGVFVKTHHEYTAIYRSAEGKLVRTPLRLVGSVDGMALLQTADGKTPDGVAAVSLLPWNMDDDCEARAVGFPTIGEEGMECDTVSAQILPMQVEQGRKHRLPRMLGSDGTPVFSTKGRFIGMVCGDTIATRRAIRKILNFEW